MHSCRGETAFARLFFLSPRLLVATDRVPFTRLYRAPAPDIFCPPRFACLAAFSLLSFYARFSRTRVSPLIVAPDFDGWHVRFPPRSLVSPSRPSVRAHSRRPFYLSFDVSLPLSLSLLFSCISAPTSQPCLLNTCPSRGRYQHLPFVSCLPWDARGQHRD